MILLSSAMNELITIKQSIDDEVAGIYPIGGQPIANEYDLFSRI